MSGDHRTSNGKLIATTSIAPAQNGAVLETLSASSPISGALGINTNARERFVSETTVARCSLGTATARDLVALRDSLAVLPEIAAYAVALTAPPLRTIGSARWSRSDDRALSRW